MDLRFWILDSTQRSGELKTTVPGDEEIKMKRMALVLWLVFGPSVLLLSTGCEKEVRTVDRKQSVQESEPKMVSPGKEVLE